MSNSPFTPFTPLPNALKSMHLTFLDTAYKWNYAVLVFLSLADLMQHNVLKLLCIASVSTPKLKHASQTQGPIPSRFTPKALHLFTPRLSHDE